MLGVNYKAICGETNFICAQAELLIIALVTYAHNFNYDYTSFPNKLNVDSVSRLVSHIQIASR